MARNRSPRTCSRTWDPIQTGIESCDPVRLGHEETQLGTGHVNIDDVPEAGVPHRRKRDRIAAGRADNDSSAGRIGCQYRIGEFGEAVTGLPRRSGRVDLDIVGADRVSVAQPPISAPTNTCFKDLAVIEPQQYLTHATTRD